MTLVELMTVLIVFSVVMGAASSLLLTSLKVYSKSGVSVQARAASALGLDRLGRDLRQARRLITGVIETVGSTSFTFNTACNPTQVSMALPHTTTITLTGGSTEYGTDPNGSGTVPYDGWYVSYYLSSTQTAPVGAAAPAVNAVGPYLIRVQYDLTASKLSYATVAGAATALTASASGSCPTTSARALAVTVTGSATASNWTVTTTDIVTTDVTLRNQ